jgi:hypothetical protein
LAFGAAIGGEPGSSRPIASARQKAPVCLRLADDLGTMASLNLSATPDTEVNRKACTDINRWAAARHGLTRAQTRTPVALGKRSCPIDVLDFDGALWMTSNWFDRMDAGTGHCK